MAVTRWLPLGAVVLLLAILGWRAWWQRRRYGSAGVWFLRSPRWQDNLRDASGVVLVVLLIGQALTVTVEPRSLVPGTALVITGLVLLVLAQLNLGASWRIGIAPLPARAPSRIALTSVPCSRESARASKAWSSRENARAASSSRSVG